MIKTVIAAIRQILLTIIVEAAQLILKSKTITHATLKYTQK